MNIISLIKGLFTKNIAPAPVKINTVSPTNKLLVGIIKSTISTWLKSGGCNLDKWAPGVLLFHYLEGTGTNLDISNLPHIQQLASMAIARAIYYHKKSSVVPVGYADSRESKQTPTPYLGDFLNKFNELTASVGGFTAVYNRETDMYNIIDRYDWYNVHQGIDIPQCLNKLVDVLPLKLKTQLSISKCFGRYTMNQGNMIYIGKSFDTIINVPNSLVWDKFSNLEAKSNVNECDDDCDYEEDYDDYYSDLEVKRSYEGSWEEIKVFELGLNLKDLTLNTGDDVKENSDQQLMKKPLPRLKEEREGFTGILTQYVILDCPKEGYAIAEYILDHKLNSI